MSAHGPDSDAQIPGAAFSRGAVTSDNRFGSSAGTNGLGPHPTRDFLGSGWRFPPRLDARGRIELAHQEQDIDEAVRLILLTRKGERPMRPEFGSELHRLYFQPCDAATAGQARRYVMEAIARWEPRVDEVEVAAGPDPLRSEVLEIEITYRVRATNDIRNLVFPFYTIPGED